MNSIKIGHYDYEVIEEENLKFGDDEVHGLCHSGSKTIKLDAGMKPQVKTGVLIHEIVHGLITESGLEMKLNDDENEEYTELLSNALHGFLQDNIEKLSELYKSN